mgnify:CR=1 FL=1
MALGPHKIEYEVIKGWEQLPEGYSFMEVAGVACDSKDQPNYRRQFPLQHKASFTRKYKGYEAWPELSVLSLLFRRHGHRG